MASPALDRLLQPGQHGGPGCGGAVGLVLIGVVVLAESHVRRAASVSQLVSDGVVVLRLVLLPSQGTEVRQLEPPRLLHLQDLALVLIRLALPLTAPGDAAAGTPGGLHRRTEHVLRDLFRVGQCRPHSFRWRGNVYVSARKKSGHVAQLIGPGGQPSERTGSASPRMEQSGTTLRVTGRLWLH